jgi:hypothetical protein
MRRKTNSVGKRAHRPKMKLGLPDLDQAKGAVLSSLRSPQSQRGYRHTIDEFITWYCSEPRPSFNKTVARRDRIHLEDRQLAQETWSRFNSCWATSQCRQQRGTWEASSAFAAP